MASTGKMVSKLRNVLLLTGVSLLCGSIYLFITTQHFLKVAELTTGTVVELAVSRSSDGSSTYWPVVQFQTQNGQLIEFISSSGSNPPAHDLGDVIEVLYPNDEPTEAKINSYLDLWLMFIIVTALGSLFFAFGLGMLYFGGRVRRRAEYLKRNGVEIQAKFLSVEVNKMFVMNGIHPYQICVEWSDPKSLQNHIFRSDNIWFDPTEFIPAGTITVLMKSGDPNQHHVVLDFLPEEQESVSDQLPQR